MRKVYFSIGYVGFLVWCVLLSGVLPKAFAATRGIVSMPVTDKKGNPVTLYRESHALVIGVSEYTGGWPRLPGVKKDIKAVRRVLERVGFQVHVIEDPDRRELEAAFKDFVLEYGLNPENRLLFYFAGHGHTHKPKYATNDPEEWMGYIVAREAPSPKEDLTRFFQHSVSMQSIQGIALTIESKHAMFVFDSCFSGTLFGLSRAIPQDIQQRTGKPVRQFLTSGTADQVVPDISIFRRQFVSALEGDADRNADGYVTGTELGLYIEETVTNLSRRTQTPRYGKIQNRFLNKGDFVFPIQVQDDVFEDAVAEREPGDHKAIIGELVAMVQDVSTGRGDRNRRIENHYLKLKELDKFDESSVTKETKIKLWKDFINLYPDKNPRVDEAKRILRVLKGEPEVDPRKKEIETRFAHLMELDQGKGPLDQKIASWETFISKYPDNNPRMDLAQKKLQELKDQQRKAEIETQFAQVMSLDQKSVSVEDRVAAWEGFLNKYPDNNPKKEFAVFKIKEIREEKQREQAKAQRDEEKRKAQEAESQRQEQERATLAKQQEEQQRLAEQQRIAKIREARRKERELRAREREKKMQMAKLNAKSSGGSAKKSTGLENMVLIPAGSYVAGKFGAFEKKNLGAFYIDTYEVKQEEFEKVMGNNPSHFKGADLPVEKVTWEEAKEYCKRVGKRLPTPEEWEKAARGGTASKYYWGNSLGKNRANCDGCGSKFDGRKTAPAGSFPANKFGLYDMVGNVWEWVDASHERKYKFLRGGSWMDDSSFVTPEGSYFVLPKNRSGDIGFRCVRDQKGAMLASSGGKRMTTAKLDPKSKPSGPARNTGTSGMVLIPSGKFAAGEAGSLKETFAQAFYIDSYEVTQEQYEKVMGKNPSHFKGPKLPVEKVTWAEAKEYCKRIGKRLPTSTEWEKAVRGGTSSKYHWGETLKKNMANCDGCGSKFDGLKTAPVGSFSPNRFGLYDMVGNVWEWVEDSHDSNNKVLRGGSWLDDAGFMKSGSFYFVSPENRSSDIGFRCAKSK